MDPFEPIDVDPQPEQPAPESQNGQPRAPGEERDQTSRTRLDPADHALGAAQTLLILNAIDQRTDAAMAGGAEVAGVSTAAGAAGDVMVPVSPMDMDDPLDDPEGHDTAVADGSDGCAGGSFAFLLMLTAAAGTAMALTR